MMISYFCFNDKGKVKKVASPLSIFLYEIFFFEKIRQSK